MMRFENEWVLYFLGLLPILWVIYVLHRIKRKETLQKYAQTKLWSRLSNSIPVHKYAVKFILLSLAYCSAVVGAANPQVGSKLEEVKREGIDIIIALDLSKSMNATDVKPSRLDRAKLFISRFIDELAGDRIGLIIFAGNAYMQMPITIDYSAAKLFLNGLNTEIVPTQGTAIGEAIRMATESFDENLEQNKAILIISDGENHEGDAIEASEIAKDEGIIVHTIGVGSTQGGPVPLYENGIQYDYQRDKSHNIITSKLNELMLNEVAQNGGGEYFKLNHTQETVKLVREKLESIEKKEMETRVYSDYHSQFQYFFAASLFFLLLEMFVTQRKNHWLEQLNLFNS